MSIIDKILYSMQQESISGKTLKSDMPDAQAFITVSENDISFCPTEYTGVKVDEGGTKMLGKFSLNSSFDDFSIGGLWQLNPIQMSYVPSTAATPVPTFLPANPLSDVVKFAKKLAAFAAMM
jgi:hypothetical protein